MTIDTQLPTPPSEDSGYMTGLIALPSTQTLPGDPWSLRSHNSNAGSSAASSSLDELPGFEESQTHDLFSDRRDPLLISSERFDFPDPSGKASPTSSNEAEADPDTDLDDVDSEDGVSNGVEVNEVEVLPGNSPVEGRSGIGSPSSSTSDDSPFNDVNSQKRDDTIKLL